MVGGKVRGQRTAVFGVAMVEDREQQPVLGPHVVQQTGDGEPTAVGDVLHRQAPEAALGDEPGGDLDDLLPALRGRKAGAVAPQSRTSIGHHDEFSSGGGHSAPKSRYQRRVIAGEHDVWPGRRTGG